MRGTMRLYLGCVVFSLLGSLLSQRFALDPGPIAPIAAAATLLAGTLAVASGFTGRGRLFTFGSVLLLGFAAEWLGVATGWPFGEYRYTGVWAPSVTLPGGHAFPLLLPAAWLMLVGSGYQIAARFTRPGPTRVGLAAAVATLADFVMEPMLAGPLDYWRWESPAFFGAPLQNVAGWFGVSLVAAALLRRAEPVEAPAVGAWVLPVHLGLVWLLGGILSFPS